MVYKKKIFASIQNVILGSEATVGDSKFFEYLNTL